MAAVGTVDTNQMLQRRNAFANLFDLFAKAAVIEKPRRLGVVQEFHVGIGGVAKVDWDPGGSGAQDAQHAEQHGRMIVGVDGGALFALDAPGPHSAGDALAEGSGFSVGVPSIPIEDCDPVGVEIGALVEIVDRSHGSV